ncbi:hypothetical protein H5410_037364 [Solanum commersonii]|uniref:Uncharacterized protein n=1 Tax=Solanum commersonii TaxID=4109 RepID=A0A9J5YA05_SOLCO|nr:hypothetical protein H5410_037364 [Solanum commersonii]
MANKGDFNATSITNVRLDSGKKLRKGKKYHKSSEEMLLDPTPSETLISHPPSTTEENDDKHGDEVIDVTTREEWGVRIEMARQTVEILG